MIGTNADPFHYIALLRSLILSTLCTTKSSWNVHVLAWFNFSLIVLSHTTPKKNSWQLNSHLYSSRYIIPVQWLMNHNKTVVCLSTICSFIAGTVLPKNGQHSSDESFWLVLSECRLSIHILELRTYFQMCVSLLRGLIVFEWLCCIHVYSASLRPKESYHGTVSWRWRFES